MDYGFAITPAPWTLPAHVSLLTGLYPSIHESHLEVDMKSITDYARLRNDKTTLMTRLKRQGYSTYGYSANNFISSAFGFDGFDVLKNWEVPWHGILFKMDKESIDLLSKFIEGRKPRDFVSLLTRVALHQPRLFFSTLAAGIRIDLDRVLHNWPKNKGLRNVVAFIRRTKFKQPFFLFLNVLEVHEPYFEKDNLTDGVGVRSISSVQENDLHRWTAGYDFQVRYLSQEIPKLFESLKEKGLYDNTLIILTSDHGQLLGEHGWIGHGVFLYDELVKVPLFVKFPRDMSVRRVDPSGFIGLTSVPNFLLDIAEGRGTDSSLYSPQVFAESWAYNSRRLDKSTDDANNIDLTGRRICIFSENSKLTYNLSTQEIEESVIMQGVHKEQTESNLIDRCLKFTVLNDCLMSINATVGTNPLKSVMSE